MHGAVVAALDWSFDGRGVASGDANGDASSTAYDKSVRATGNLDLGGMVDTNSSGRSSEQCGRVTGL